MERKWKRILYSLEFSGMEESRLAALLPAIRKSHELGQKEVEGTLRTTFSRRWGGATGQELGV